MGQAWSPPTITADVGDWDRGGESEQGDNNGWMGRFCAGFFVYRELVVALLHYGR